MGSVQAVQTSTEKEAKQSPESMAPQDPEELKATPEPQLFTRRQCLSETEEEQQDPQPVWDKEPTFWSDTLTQELWKLFRENPENQQAQEGEGPHSRAGGRAVGVQANLIALHLSSSSPVVMAIEELLGLVSTLGWDPQHTSALQRPSHFIPALCWVQPWTPRHLLGSPGSCVP